MKKSDLQILYVAGNGRSGSTLIGILLGAAEGHFCAGELTNIGRNEITDEFCSCGQKIKDCNIWKDVFDLWQERSPLSPEAYQLAKRNFEGNKNTLTIIKNYLFPGAAFSAYQEATKSLLEAIAEVTGRSVIIDTSKSAQRILVLKSIFRNVHVVHICRKFSGVLNSTQKHFKRDVKGGIEQEIRPRRVSKVLFDWIATNLVISVVTAGGNKTKLKYQYFVNHVADAMRLISKKSGIQQLGHIAEQKVFHPEHIVAGNRIRLQSSMEISPKVGRQLNNLNKNQRRLANLVDHIFFFW